MNFHCEITGQETTLNNTVALVKIDGIAVLKNFSNPIIDLQNKLIVSDNKQPLKFHSEIIVPEDLKNIFGRLFSIIDDEDDLEKSTAIMSTEGIRLFSGQQIYPLAEYIGNGIELLNIPTSMFFSVIDNSSNMSDKVCYHLNLPYKSVGQKYRSKKILAEKTESQIFGTPYFLLPGYDVAVSDCCEKNPNGTGYLFKTEKSFKAINLCSNESAVSYCIEENAIVYYNDFLNNGKLRVLTAYTESININMQNPYKFRSSNI